MPLQKGFMTVVERELRGLLPKMSNLEDEFISFFSAFERILELYEADTLSYARLLPGCLSARFMVTDSTPCVQQSARSTQK
jgi:hypothetical protein